MSKKNKKLKKKELLQRVPQQIPKIICKPMTGNAPMAVYPASSFVQLTPIIQPIALVPQGGQQHAAGDDDEFDDI